jgi:1-acyl-sn-glycerol-3-phosphate acyltransferase
LTDRARRGDVLVFFPEGTFTRRPGLSEFRLGAFTVAAEASVPVVPGVLTGTRSMLRAGQRFPRRAHLGVQFTEPVGPSGSADFSSAVRLRDEARAAILARCKEPNLRELVTLTASGPAPEDATPSQP